MIASPLASVVAPNPVEQEQARDQAAESAFIDIPLDEIHEVRERSPVSELEGQVDADLTEVVVTRVVGRTRVAKCIDRPRPQQVGQNKPCRSLGQACDSDTGRRPREGASFIQLDRAQVARQEGGGSLGQAQGTADQVAL